MKRGTPVAALNARFGKGNWGKGKKKRGSKKSSKKTTSKRGRGRPKGSKNVRCIVNLRDLQDLASGKAVLRRG